MYFTINNEITYILKNVYLDEIWDECIPLEALRPSPGNRWHVQVKDITNMGISDLDLGTSTTIAYQDYLEGYDNEQIYVVRSR